MTLVAIRVRRRSHRSTVHPEERPKDNPRNDEPGDDERYGERGPSEFQNQPEQGHLEDVIPRLGDQLRCPQTEEGAVRKHPPVARRVPRVSSGGQRGFPRFRSCRQGLSVCRRVGGHGGAMSLEPTRQLSLAARIEAWASLECPRHVGIRWGQCPQNRSKAPQCPIPIDISFGRTPADTASHPHDWKGASPSRSGRGQ